MKIDAIGVTSKDLRKTVSFYELLGFTFPEMSGDEDHIEATSPAGVRLMIDSASLIESIIGEAPRPGNASAFAILCETVDEVNQVTQKIQDAGYTVIKEPWDAEWGQRYAIVADPDGYKVDLFAAL
ncbi:MAG: VOC family protein [Weeksellaceae bacterium]